MTRPSCGARPRCTPSDTTGAGRRSGARPSPAPGTPAPTWRSWARPPAYRRIRLAPGRGRHRGPFGHLLQDRRRAGPDVLRRPDAGHDRLPAVAGPDAGIVADRRHLYEGYPVDAPYVIHQPDHWLYAGTRVRARASLRHLVGVEFDRVNLGYPTPRPIQVLARSPVVCEGRPDYSDTAYYTTSSGAGVFASGTMRWVESMMAGHRGDGDDHYISAAAGDFTTRVNTNLLLGFAGEAREFHPPARDNLSTLAYSRWTLPVLTGICGRCWNPEGRSFREGAMPERPPFTVRSCR